MKTYFMNILGEKTEQFGYNRVKFGTSIQMSGVLLPEKTVPSDVDEWVKGGDAHSCPFAGQMAP